MEEPAPGLSPCFGYGCISHGSLHDLPSIFNCVQIFPSGKDASHIRLEPTPMTSL